MANTRIDQLPDSSGLDGSELVAGYRDSNQSGKKTVKIDVTRIAALNNAAISAASVAANAAQSTADAAIPASQKGSANGVATLDGSGKIPASQLTITGTSFKGNWDATANTPTLSDGTGSGGDWYFVQNGASRNLGSGSVDWTTGALIIHNGTIWVENEATNVVLSVNGLAGVVVLDADDIAETASNKYVTANQKNALAGTYGTASLSNKFVTDTDPRLSGSGLSVIRQFNTIQAYEVDGHLSGQGISTTMAALGYTNSTAAVKFPYTAIAWGTINASAVTYDTCVIQEAIYRLGYERYQNIESEYNRLYIVNRQIVIPSVKQDVDITDRTGSQSFTIDFSNARVNDIRTVTTGVPLFIKEPSNESNAANHDLENSWTIENLNLYGEAISGLPYANSVAMKIGAGKRINVKNCTFHNFDLPIIGSLWLNSLVTECEFVNCISAGFKSTQSWWSGGTANTSPSQITFINNRFKDAGSKYLWLENADTTSLEGNNQFEGDGGDYAIYWNNLSGSVIKNLSIHNIRVEQESKFARAIIGTCAGDGFAVEVNKVFHQAATAGTVLVESEGVGGDTRIDIQNCYNSGGNTAWKLRHIENGGNTSWEIHKTELQGQPQTEANLISNAGSYANIWASDFGGSVPSSNRVNFTPRLPKT